MYYGCEFEIQVSNLLSYKSLWYVLTLPALKGSGKLTVRILFWYSLSFGASLLNTKCDY